ncbi:MAG TPA: HDOD domain-containing protein [Tepidisphaeraceae bacterium]|jgi:putative nucleotidyltransferase with HDIG domain|nr:HDOD domain-containing protein [Tepidisphaeraceae bacterium]
MSMVESTNAVTIDTPPTGFGAWLRSLFSRLFGGTPAGPSAHANSATPAHDMSDDEAVASGAFVLADGGYRIRVPHPSDVGHSVGDLLPSVREGLNLLPPLPTVVIELLREIQDSKSTAASVAEVASSDPSLAASLLRTANGAAMGLSRTITSVSEAVSYLGFGTVKAMVIRLRLDEVLACKDEQAARDADDLWAHSLAVSYAAEYLAKKLGGVDPGFVSTLGLLHDVGKLAILAHLPNAAAKLRAESSDGNVSRLAMEAKVLGIDHAGLGANLSAKWKLPADLVQAIRSHHTPSSAFHATDPLPLRKAVHIVQIANQLAKYCYSHADQMDIDAVPDEVFALLGMEPSLPKLLSGGVRDAIGKAIIFATTNSRRAASAPRRFMRPLAKDAAAALLATPASGEARVVVDEELVASAFSAESREVRIQGDSGPKLAGVAHARFVTPANPASIEKCITAVLSHQEELGMPLDARSAASLTIRSLLPNLLALNSKEESIELSQKFEGGRLTLALRTPGLSIERRLGAAAASDAARRVAELDMANLLNLGWFQKIAINKDGSAIVFVRS